MLAIADNAARLPNAGPTAAVLIVAAAWTGMRWGEIVALQRHNTHLDTPLGVGCLVVDPHVGAMIESSRGVELGTPKTAESAPTITVPPFLVAMLRRHLDSHGQRFVFVTPGGEPHRNSKTAVFRGLGRCASLTCTLMLIGRHRAHIPSVAT